MAAVIDQGEVARLRAHSAYWAPFVVVGEGGVAWAASQTP